MKEEELKQRAKSYAGNCPIPYSLYEKIEDKKEQMGEVIEQAYLAGTRELEAENNRLKEQIEKMKEDVRGNIKWADMYKNDQMYCKLNVMLNQWKVAE